MKQPILIYVDDDALALEFLSSSIHRRKCGKVFVTTDPYEALTYVQTKKPDLAILDIIMPRIDGITLAKKFRMINEKLPIIFISSSDYEYEKIENSFFFKKPVDYQKICDKIIEMAK